MGTSRKQSKHFKQDVTVDASFLATPEVTLQAKPKENSDLVFLNGLLLEDDCYSISGMTLTVDPGLELEIGDLIMIRYSS